MRFNPLPLEGAFLIDLQMKEDERGFFSRLFCVKEFAEKDLETSFVQSNNSQSKFRGTLRGLHYQMGEWAEVKLVRCIQGALFDVIVDVRPKSPTFGKWFGEVLSAHNRSMMYVPRGFAHGFLTLEPNSEVIYLVSQYYSQECERGIRWNDPAIDIKWPFEPSIISERDQSHPDFICGELH